MKQKKIQIENQDFDSAKASKHKDFSKVLETYENTPDTNSGLSKSGKLLASLAVTAVIVGSFLFFFLGNNKKAVEEANKLEIESPEYAIQEYTAPFTEYNMPYEIFEIKKVEGNQLLSERGSIIDLKDVIFVDENGKVVQEDVEIWYREFHNPFEIFMAGIPMTTPTDSGNMQLVSAGMFELLAIKDGKELSIKDGTAMEVNLVSYDASEGFNDYVLNENTNQWDYINESEISEMDFVSPTTFVPEFMREDPIREPISTPNNVGDSGAVIVEFFEEVPYFLELDIDAKATPELAAFESVVFKVDQSKAFFDPKYYDIRWTNMLVNQIEGNDYRITLIKEDTLIEIYANPVISDEMEKSRMAYNSTQQKKKDLKKERYSEPAARNFIRRTRFDQANELVQTMIENSSGNPVYRTVIVFTTGVFNCDYPLAPYKSIAKLEITDQHGQKIDYTNLFMADVDQNSVFNMGTTSVIRYSPRVKAVLWLINKNGNIGIANPETFDHNKLGKEVAVEFKLFPTKTGLQMLKSMI